MESMQQQMSMSHGGLRRGGERGQFDQQVGPDGWAVTGGSGPPVPPSKAGDLYQFSKISKTTPMTFGPSNVFTNKKDNKGRAESLTRTNSSSNMFSMLNSEMGAESNRVDCLAGRQVLILGNPDYPRYPPNERDLTSFPGASPQRKRSHQCPQTLHKRRKQRRHQCLKLMSKRRLTGVL